MGADIMGELLVRGNRCRLRISGFVVLRVSKERLRRITKGI